ncbi:hypothetical protein NDU88_001234 [Pleurodeles waltl]|uniref:Uncharacterized protein n=1 Tax=Pleurodeles waltl TaxID=8319 RepID=A0AAV7U9R3_PLEWA|nr:hypothetical protein NDU88_001234 [Pleurodeles waltl]
MSVRIRERTDVGEGKEKMDQEQDAYSSRSEGRQDRKGRNQRNGDDEENTPQAGVTKETSPRNSRVEGEEQTEVEKCVGARGRPWRRKDT